MARKTDIIDDYDGSKGASERFFSIGDRDYTIDLTDANWEAFLESISKFRRVAPIAKKSRKNASPIRDPEDKPKIRQWAKDTGYELAERGRFPNELVEAYYHALEMQRRAERLGEFVRVG
jgi:hypothetical protein